MKELIRCDREQLYYDVIEEIIELLDNNYTTMSIYRKVLCEFFNHPCYFDELESIICEDGDVFTYNELYDLLEILTVNFRR